MKKGIWGLLFISQALFAQETVVYFNSGSFKSVGCDQAFSNQYSSAVWEKVIGQKEFSRDAAAAAKAGSPVYSIRGTIQFIPVKKDDKVVTKYLSEEKTGDKYQITVTVINTSTGKTDAAFYDTVYDTGAFHASAVKIANQIIRKYRPASAPQAAKKAPVENDGTGLTIKGAELAPLASFGIGKYKDYNKYGFGLSGAVLMQYDRVLIKPALNVTYAVPGVANIHKNINANARLQFGYFIYTYKAFSLTPYIGIGMIYHYISGEKDGKNKIYNYINPVANFSLSAEYMINERFGILFIPQYNIFIEKSAADQYLEAAAGIKFYL